MDDAILDSLAGMDLALVALDLRSRTEDDLLPAIFSTDELPYGSGFSVSVGTARRRLREARDQNVLNAFPSYAAEFGLLLSGVTRMLREIGVDDSKPGGQPIDMSKKLAHLETHAGIRVEKRHDDLWRLLVAIRHSVMHSGAATGSVLAAWAGCRDAGGMGPKPEDAQDLWTRHAGRSLPISPTDPRLRFGDREVVACQRVLDTIAVDLAEQLRQRVAPIDWARLLLRHEPKPAWVLNDPSRNARKLQAWCRQEWAVEVDEGTARQALDSPLR
jgi:hypothetical protein